MSTDSRVRHVQRLTCSLASEERGAALFLTFLLMLMLAGLALAVATFSQNSQLTGKSQFLDKQAFYIAEAGWQRARQAVVAGTWSAAASPGNTYTESFGAGEYKVTIVDNTSTYTITSEGYVPSQTTPAARRKVLETTVPVTTGGGTNLSLSATALASSSQNGHPPADAKDSQLNTFWSAENQGSNEWLAMDYGSATSLNQMIIREKDGIDGLTIQSSSDGSSWTTVSGLGVVESPAQTWTANFSSASAQFFRAVFTSVPSNKRARVKELESYNTSITLGQGTFTTQW